MKKIIFIILVLLISIEIHAQNEASNDKKQVKVHLKDGSIISGRLLSWTYEKEIVVESHGVTLAFPDNKVKKVVEFSAPSKIKAPVHHENNGIYYTVKAQILAGNEGIRAHHLVGYGVTASAGYQWHQYLAAGIGTGYRQFIWEASEKVIPVFAEVKGFMNNKVVRPFYNVELGYSFGLTDEGVNLIKSKGGLSVYPSLGLSFGRHQMKYTMDIGYLFQDLEVTYGNTFDDRVQSIQDLRYQRLTFRFGIVF